VRNVRKRAVDFILSNRVVLRVGSVRIFSVELRKVQELKMRWRTPQGSEGVVC